MGRGRRFSNTEKKMTNTNEIHDQNWYAKNFPKLITEDDASTNFHPILGKPRDTPTNRPCNREMTYFVSVTEALSQEVMSKSTMQEKNNGKSAKRNYENSELCCMICRCVIPENNRTDHLYDKRHVNAKKKYHCRDIIRTADNIHRCKRCDCEILNLEDLYHHLMSNEHLTLLSAIEIKDTKNREILEEPILQEVKIPKENSVDNSSLISGESLPSGHISSDIYIVRRNAKRSYCKICNENWILTKNIVDHIDTPSHQISLKKYGCNNIILNENGSYVCTCCKLEIADIENVHLHVMDKKHMSSLIKFSFQEDTHTSKDIFERDTTPMENDQLHLNNTVSDYIFKHITTYSSGNGARDILKVWGEREQRELLEEMKRSSRIYKPGRLMFRKHIISQRKLLPRNHSCPICMYKIKNLKELFSHMAQHYIDDISSVTGNNGVIFEYSNIETKLSLHLVDRLDVAINGNTSNNEAISIIENTSDESDLNTEFLASCSLPNPASDYIYDMSEKNTILRVGLNLSLIVNSQSIYCLVCRKTVKSTLQDYFEHLWGIEHCGYLEMMENDHAQFEETPDEFSDLDLACEFMQEINDDFVRCLICNLDISNSDELLERHIYDEIHERLLKEIKTNAMIHYNEKVSRTHCDWYSIDKYWCVPCSYKGVSSREFVQHLNEKRHTKKLNMLNNSRKKMMFDFCSSCALLWYGYRTTYFYHSEVPAHKWLLNEGYYTIGEFPEAAKDLLISAEKYATEAIKSLDDTAKVENDKLKTLIQDIETVARIKFPKAKAYVFGSRAAGVSSLNSNVDVYLDCRDLDNGQQVIESMRQYPESWEVKTLKAENQVPAVKVTHRTTGLICDISFDNGIPVESSKLIRTFNNVFPSCRKLILVLKQWLTLCNLFGSKEITTYALCWLVIFYLQQETIFPSVATLIAMKKKSQIIDGWETAVSHEFAYNETEGALTITQLLKRFFTFYADFDFRYEVACPVVGTTIKKYELRNPTNFAVITENLEHFETMKHFVTSSPMCIQDPFNLQCNLTSNARKCYTNCFRVYCSKSRDLLC